MGGDILNVRKIFILMFSFSVLSVSGYYTLNSQYYTFREETGYMISNISNDISKNSVENIALPENLVTVPFVEKNNENSDIKNKILESSSLKENADNDKIEEGKEDNFPSDYNAGDPENNFDSFDVRVSDPEIVIAEGNENDSYGIGNRPSFPDTKTSSVSDDLKYNEEKNNYEDSNNSTSKKSNYKSADTSPERTEKEIVDEYVAKFSDLRKEFNLDIDNLVDAAKEEYYGIDHDKRGQFVKYLSEKYLNQAVVLENNGNEKFYNLLKIMEKDLKENHCSLESIEVVEDTFVKEKRAKKNELMSKAIKILQ
jgi:hypothetical protein